MRVRSIRLEPRSTRRWAIGCLVLALLLTLGLGLGLMTGVAGLAGVFRHLAGGGDHGTVAPPGDPRAFDPVASYAQVARHAGVDARLQSFEAVQVTASGTLDLLVRRVPGPRVAYRFVLPAAAPADAPPLGAGAPEDGRWWQEIEVQVTRPGERRRVRSIGAGGQVDVQYVSRGMQRLASPVSGRAPATAVAAPRCPLRTLWAAAIARGAPAQAVATIAYDADGYAWSIPGTRWSFEFDADCRPR